MTYRGDGDPLKAQETALASELSSIRRRERAVARALDDTRSKLRRKSALPVLDDVRVASPCSASWEDMSGDARVRFCGKCEKNVYNLSEMTRDEAESLLAKTEGNLCVRLYKRKDGTVMTTDCPVGVRRKRVRRGTPVDSRTRVLTRARRDWRSACTNPGAQKIGHETSIHPDARHSQKTFATA